ncbi:MAG: hypothetical protein N4J56_007839 [Chroococcidiopsis sp. SAG 2025]|uniref:hypothetical protein n=1 Tax=Chroococcidiopsis sp. SAG 2025 TaxID=171389 RepID=UPI0029373CD8|nr:hypothetical protein [Chroococcidiopsis sp. SAG 2025]MDV2998134.1 hypothetical protein [Chroococcidiopsis sp. SAG 2025]
MTIIRIEHSSNYTCISNQAIRDKRLSYKARGLHHLLLSYPNNWTVNIDHLVAASDKDGRAAVMSAIEELQAHGYMTMRRIRNEQTGQFVGWEKVIRETPIPQDEAIPAEVRKSNLGKKDRKIGTATEVRKSNLGETEVRKSNVGETEVRKTVLRSSRKTDKPHDGKSEDIINNHNSNKYLDREVSITPLPPCGERQVSGTQLELCFSQALECNTHPLASHTERSHSPGLQVKNFCGEKLSAPCSPVENLPKAGSTQTALSPVEVVAVSQNQSGERFSRDRSQYPKNYAANVAQDSSAPAAINGSDRLPWETGRRGVFDPDFEQHMARSLGNYPAYKDLLPGELLVKVRKHICAAKYDLKRRDELEIEWSAMHSLPQLPDGVSKAEVGAAKTYAHFAHLFGVR